MEETFPRGSDEPCLKLTLLQPGVYLASMLEEENRFNRKPAF